MVRPQKPHTHKSHKARLGKKKAPTSKTVIEHEGNMSAPAEVCFFSELSACWTSKPRSIKSVATSCLQRSDDDHRNSECKHSFPKSTNKYKKTPSYGYVLKRIHQKAEYLQFSSLKIWVYMVYSFRLSNMKCTWDLPGFPTVSGTHLDRPSRNASMTVSRSSRHFRKPWRWLWNLDIYLLKHQRKSHENSQNDL